jgi:hypothetical protein
MMSFSSEITLLFKNKEMPPPPPKFIDITSLFYYAKCSYNKWSCALSICFDDIFYFYALLLSSVRNLPTLEKQKFEISPPKNGL